MGFMLPNFDNSKASVETGHDFVPLLKLLFFAVVGYFAFMWVSEHVSVKVKPLSPPAVVAPCQCNHNGSTGSIGETK